MTGSGTTSNVPEEASVRTVDSGAHAELPAPASRSRQPRKEAGTREKLLHFTEKYALVALFLLTLLFFSLWHATSDTFLSTANVKNVLGNQAVVGILALAIIIPLVCNQFDLAVGSIAGLSQVLVAGFMARQGMPALLAIGLAVLIGALIGLGNGNTIARVGVNSLIVTLGVSTLLLGVVEWYTDGLTLINGISPTLISAGTGDWLGVPKTLYYLAAVALFVYYLLEQTPFGRYLHSIGSNPEAARLVGVRSDRMVLIAYTVSGALSGIAGVLLVARNGSAGPTVGTISDTLAALSAAFLGATAIRPGRFNVLGTLVAIFFLAFTITGLTLAGVASWINSVFSGAALFLAVLISTIVGRKRVGSD